MLIWPHFNPIAFHLGPLAVHWYGLTYLVGFLLCWAMLRWRLQILPCEITTKELPDLLFYAAFGVILGGRLGYMLFYDFPDVLRAPWKILLIWQGGMSFHGGLLGVIISLVFYARKTGRSLFALTDFVAPVVPIGLAAGRIGNFVNGELWGRVTSMPWGMVFPWGGPLPRHPSQLYEFALEGVLLFFLLWIYARKARPAGAVSGCFLIFYGVFRFCVEFFREPDVQVGFVFGWMTEGQLLCLPMIFVGAGLVFWAYRKKRQVSGASY